MGVPLQVTRVPGPKPGPVVLRPWLPQPLPCALFLKGFLLSHPGCLTPSFSHQGSWRGAQPPVQCSCTAPCGHCEDTKKASQTAPAEPAVSGGLLSSGEDGGRGKSAHRVNGWQGRGLLGDPRASLQCYSLPAFSGPPSWAPSVPGLGHHVPGTCPSLPPDSGSLSWLAHCGVPGVYRTHSRCSGTSQ